MRCARAFSGFSAINQARPTSLIPHYLFQSLFYDRPWLQIRFHATSKSFKGTKLSLLSLLAVCWLDMKSTTNLVSELLQLCINPKEISAEVFEIKANLETRWRRNWWQDTYENNDPPILDVIILFFVWLFAWNLDFSPRGIPFFLPILSWLDLWSLENLSVKDECSDFTLNIDFY